MIKVINIFYKVFGGFAQVSPIKNKNAETRPMSISPKMTETLDLKHKEPPTWVSYNLDF